ncbi:MAG: phospholipid carrier-dependent glycosyltransferase [Bacillota bacterium]
MNNTKKAEIYDGVEKIISKKQNGRMVKKDWTILAVILALVTLLTFVNFATTSTPQTGTQTTAEGQYFIVEVPDGTSVGDIYYYASVSENDSSSLVISTANSLTQSSWVSKKSFTFANSSMYSWELMHDFEGKVTDKYIIFKFADEGTAINEIVLTSNLTGEAIACTIVESTVPNAEYLFDESKYFTGQKTNVNSMYFDEIYFARTAYEILNDLAIYETSHPHLGKLLMAVGVMAFGMNPFGYRIMGLLFSIFSVFALYLLGKKVFKSTKFATVMAIFFACDGLRYVQGRIGTVDSFLVVFIIMAFYFMYTFFERGMDVNSIKRSLLPFCISGVFFGLAVSVKWNGMYAGLGLCILFLIVLARTFSERAKFMQSGKSEGDIKVYNKRFIDAIIMMFVSGVMFFVLIPLGTYFSVFALTYQGGEELIPAFIQTQVDMFSYHTWVSAEHSAASPWWSWPLNGKGVWMYLGDSNYGTDMYSRIQSMTTTVIAVYGVLAMVYFARKAVYYFKKKKSGELSYSEKEYFNHIKIPAIFFTVGLLSNWLPWMFVSRSTYLYHFYPAMPFYIGLIATYLYSKTLLQTKVHYSGEMVMLNGKKGTITVGENATFYACVFCIINFVVFFPVFSGLAIAKLPAAFMFGWANGFWGFGLFPY